MTIRVPAGTPVALMSFNKPFEEEFTLLPSTKLQTFHMRDDDDDKGRSNIELDALASYSESPLSQEDVDWAFALRLMFTVSEYAPHTMLNNMRTHGLDVPMSDELHDMILQVQDQIRVELRRDLADHLRKAMEVINKLNVRSTRPQTATRPRRPAVEAVLKRVSYF